jgi:cytochrome c biogenesis factor
MSGIPQRAAASDPHQFQMRRTIGLSLSLVCFFPKNQTKNRLPTQKGKMSQEWGWSMFVAFVALIGMVQAQTSKMPRDVKFSNSTPFFVGTAVYIGIAVASCIATKLCGRFEKKELYGLVYLMITIAAICMWMMWAMAWLAQWHPLIAPEYEDKSK